MKTRAFNTYHLLLTGFLVAMIAVLSLLSPHFLSLKNSLNILNQAATPIMMAIGMTFVIGAGGIDLSVGSMVAFSGLTAGFMLKAGWPVILVIAAVLAIGYGIGMFSGFLISRGGVNPFIVTLSMMTILRGVTILMNDGKPIYQFEATFTFLGMGSLLGIKVPIVLAALTVAVAALLLNRTKFGSYCLFLGSNERALHRSGVRVTAYRMAVFGLSAMLAALCGMMIAAKMNTADPLAGSGYEMDAIAAVILGGTSLNGGTGTIKGTVLACLILHVMKNGLTMLAVSSNYQRVLTGVIVLGAALISVRRERTRARR